MPITAQDREDWNLEHKAEQEMERKRLARIQAVQNEIRHFAAFGR